MMEFDATIEIRRKHFRYVANMTYGLPPNKEIPFFNILNPSLWPLSILSLTTYLLFPFLPIFPSPILSFSLFAFLCLWLPSFLLPHDFPVCVCRPVLVSVHDELATVSRRFRRRSCVTLSSIAYCLSRVIYSLTRSIKSVRNYTAVKQRFDSSFSTISNRHPVH